MRKEDLDDLVGEIEEKEGCVILVGPEFGKINGDSITTRVHQKVLDDWSEKIAYYHSTDNLFLFNSDRDREKVRREVRKAYRTLEFPEENYRQILEIPVSLIISLSPDTFLTELATRLGIPHAFNFFRYSGGHPEEVEKPTCEKPLVYNLFGSRTEDESLVLNYEDLFSLLKAILPNGLPANIRSQLNRASHILFLGCDFERWYTQLIFQLITQEGKGQTRFALKGKPPSDPTRDFVIRQFEVEFLDPKERFFDQLYTALKEKGLLRDLNPFEENGKVSLKALKDLIAEGHLEQAIEKTRAILPNAELLDTWIVLSGQAKDHFRKELNGTYLPGEGQTIQARITEELLRLLDDIQ